MAKVYVWTARIAASGKPLGQCIAQAYPRTWELFAEGLHHG